MDKLDKISVALDAMGGDHAPGEVVKGALLALAAEPRLHIHLVGREEALKRELEGQAFDSCRLHLVPATQEIAMAEPPVAAIRSKKDSSLVKAMYLVREGQCQALVSAGSTGAVLVGGQMLVGRIKGVERPPLAPLIPTAKGVALLVDCGANVDARASHLLQFARIGSLYMQNVLGLEKPRVAIVNIGAEEEKGNALVKETFPLLKACPDIHFIGSIEARDIPAGEADVIVCEAFVGNVILKLYEGVGKTLISQIKGALLSTPLSKIGALLAKPALKKALKAYDLAEYGGAPLLGLKGLVVKCHGSSKAGEVKNALLQCVAFCQGGMGAKLEAAFGASGAAETGQQAE